RHRSSSVIGMAMVGCPLRPLRRADPKAHGAGRRRFIRRRPTSPAAYRTRLGPSLEYQVQRTLGRTPEAAESRLLEHRPQPGLAGLSAEPQSDLLREGVRRTDR